MAPNRSAIVTGALLASLAAAALLSARFGEKSKSPNNLTRPANPLAEVSQGPMARTRQSAPAVAPLPQAANTQNEFAADDSVVQRAADDFAAQSQESAARKFATSFRELAGRFTMEHNTDSGSKLRTEILNHLSEGASSATMALQLECRQTICRVQLAGSDPEKSKTMEDIQIAGGFGQVIGMERPSGDGSVISDFYLVMKAADSSQLSH